MSKGTGFINQVNLQTSALREEEAVSPESTGSIKH